MFRRISSKWSHHDKSHDAEKEKHGAPADSKSERPHKDVHFQEASAQGVVDDQARTPGGQHVKFSPDPEKAGSHVFGTFESNPVEQQQEKINDSNPTTAAPPVNSEHVQPPSAAHLDTLITSAPPTAIPDGSHSGTPSRTPSLRSLRFPWSPRETDEERQAAEARRNAYTGHWREREAKSFVQQLRPWHGRLNHDQWLKVAVRPFILFTYPSVLWSAIVYACSVGWLIVVSESVTVIYREDYYHFNALQTGLMYISPFVGGVLGTAVAGRVSDVVVKAMTRRNGGLYEPEFRLVMAVPITITTIMGLMGYGWSAERRDEWIVPTVFLGVVSFGCSLGSTTAITFCVDSYRQYAGEALVTLNFAKNIFHGLVFSFFVTGWIEEEGSRSVFIWIGIIQLVVMAFTVPMFIFGKRARMWTIRRNFMEKF